MDKKKTLTIGIVIIAVCLTIALGYVLTHRSEKRGPTAEEMSEYAAYSIDWQKATGQEGTDVEIILSLCERAGEQTIGQNVYDIYNSDLLRNYLPDFGEMMQIARMKEGGLYIQYTTPEGNMITLGYTEAGLAEKSIYDLEADTMYYEANGTAEVWTKFRNGFQWGE